MAKMTPEQEAAYALDFGIARGDLGEQAQLAYDRLMEQRAHPPAPLAPGAATPASAGPLASGLGWIPAPTMTVNPALLRPRRAWYWVALAAALAGFAWAGVMLVLLVGEVNSFQRVPVQGTGQVSLQSGQYVIYYETPESFSGFVPTGHLNVTPLSGSGAVGRISGFSGSLTYSTGSRHGTAVAEVQITQPGRFLVQSTSSPAVQGARLAIGPSIARWVWLTALPALGLVLGGIAVLIVVAVMRRNHRRLLLTQPWQTPPWLFPPPPAA